MKSFDRLLALAQKLRGPEGCPWDQKQTLNSLMLKLGEECEEIQLALKKKDHENLKEEFGDTLFVLIMMLRIAQEQKLFTFSQVCQRIERKIISRHSWVFGAHQGKITTVSEIKKQWVRNKQLEKQRKAQRQAAPGDKGKKRAKFE